MVSTPDCRPSRKSWLKPGRSPISVSQGLSEWHVCRYEPTSMRAIRARYNPYVQARARVDQLRRLGHSVDKVCTVTSSYLVCSYLIVFGYRPSREQPALIIHSTENRGKCRERVKNISIGVSSAGVQLTVSRRWASGTMNMHRQKASQHWHQLASCKNLHGICFSFLCVLCRWSSFLWEAHS